MRSLRGLGREAAQPPGRARVLSGLRRFCACELSRCQAIPPQPTVVGMSAVLEIDKLSLRFGGIVALDDVSLSVGASQLMAVVGPNGAGKTSLLNCISGVYRPTQGRIAFEGSDRHHSSQAAYGCQAGDRPYVPAQRALSATHHA